MKKEMNLQSQFIVKLTKVGHNDENVTEADWSYVKEIGYTKEGIFNGPPMVGLPFKIGSTFSTDEVEELRPNKRFVTKEDVWLYEVEELFINQGAPYTLVNYGTRRTKNR